MEKGMSDQQIKAWTQKSLELLKIYEKDTQWKANGVVKGDRPCKIFKKGVDSRVASMGVVENVEGTLQQLADMLQHDDCAYLLDTQLKQIRRLHQIPKDKIIVSCLQFKGIGPVSDRDVVLSEITTFENNGNKFYLSSNSCPYPEPEIKGVVRAQCIVGGYIGQKIDEKTIKVTYISDADLKGHIPDFVKNLLSQGQGEVASRVNEALKKYRALKQKKN